MVEGTFGADGKLAKTGPSGVTAEGLGATNIKGVDDKKTSADPEADTGRQIQHEKVTSDTIPRVGTDPASACASASSGSHPVSYCGTHFCCCLYVQAAR